MYIFHYKSKVKEKPQGTAGKSIEILLCIIWNDMFHKNVFCKPMKAIS